MIRRGLAATLLAAWTAGLSGAAALAQEMPLVGFLSGASEHGYARFVDAFRQGLADTGHVEGRNVRVDYRWAEGRSDRLEVLAGELVKERVAVLTAVGGPAAALAAKSATAAIPIVFLSGSDPIAQGLVANLGRPEGNLTGLTFFAAELAPKRLQLLRELSPGVMPIAVLGNPNGTDTAPALEEVRSAAAKLGQDLLPLQASTPDGLERAFPTIAEHRVHALVILADPFFVAHRDQLQALSERYGIATICPGTAYAAACTMTYGPKLTAMYRGAGHYVGKVLSGTKPSDLPVERATELQLVVNLKSAKALGLAVPQSLLARADEIIE